jgi:hypothetical protein
MILDDAQLRCWGVDDPRAVHCLAYENDPGNRLHRARVVEARAVAAGWPNPTNLRETNAAQQEALRRLEVEDFTPRGIRDRHRAALRRLEAREAARWDDLTDLDEQALA